jgi:apolipoprotein N-acyltransferase
VVGPGRKPGEHWYDGLTAFSALAGVWLAIMAAIFFALAIFPWLVREHAAWAWAVGVAVALGAGSLLYTTGYKKGVEWEQGREEREAREQRAEANRKWLEDRYGRGANPQR